MAKDDPALPFPLFGKWCGALKRFDHDISRYLCPIPARLNDG